MDEDLARPAPTHQDQEIIQGLQIEVHGQELYEHLEARAQMHAEKAEGYEKQRQGLEELEDGPSDQSMDPKRGIADKIRQHRQRAQLFKFMADHVLTTARYRLDESDLMRVEYMDRGW